jgi:hypothetical protein
MINSEIFSRLCQLRFYFHVVYYTIMHMLLITYARFQLRSVLQSIHRPQSFDLLICKVGIDFLVLVT